MSVGAADARALVDGLRIPLVAAPMTGVSGLDLAREACRQGIVGAFPTHNCASPGQLDEWLGELREVAAPDEVAWSAGPFAPNLIVHRTNARLEADLAVLVRHRAPVVITSVGSPEDVVGPLHGAGSLVFADVASLRHVERALAVGVDGLILLTAGAGGQTGWVNPFAFVRAVRTCFDGPVVLAGGISDGAALFAAVALGCDLAYMGTRFIATHESLASAGYRDALVHSSLDDVVATTGATGLTSNMVTSSPSLIDGANGGGDEPSGFDAARLGGPGERWSAGHSVSGVSGVTPVEELVSMTEQEFVAARQRAVTSPGR